MTASSSAQEIKTPDAKVAVVNGTVINQDDFNKELNIAQQRLAKMGQSLNDSQLKTLKTEVLERLIDRELLYQESRKNGINIDEAEINEQLSTLKKSFPNEDEFKKALQKMDFSEPYLKTQIKRDLTIKKFIDKKFFEKVVVSEDETKGYYDSHPNAFKQTEQVKASHILIKVDPQADESKKAEAHRKIEEIQKKIQKGEDFSTLAKEFSQCPSSAQGGDLGYFERGQMVKPFDEAAFALAPGEISGIVETKFGYHIIKTTDKKEEGSISYKDVKEKLQQYLKQNKVKEQVNSYIDELKKKAKVERFMT